MSHPPVRAPTRGVWRPPTLRACGADPRRRGPRALASIALALAAACALAAGGRPDVALAHGRAADAETATPGPRGATAPGGAPERTHPRADARMLAESGGAAIGLVGTGAAVAALALVPCIGRVVGTSYEECLLGFGSWAGLTVGLFIVPALVTWGNASAGFRTSYLGSVAGAAALGVPTALAATLLGNDWTRLSPGLPLAALALGVGAVLGAELFTDEVALSGSFDARGAAVTLSVAPR
jgi:hypothetical protein